MVGFRDTSIPQTGLEAFMVVLGEHIFWTVSSIPSSSIMRMFTIHSGPRLQQEVTNRNSDQLTTFTIATGGDETKFMPAYRLTTPSLQQEVTKQIQAGKLP